MNAPDRATALVLGWARVYTRGLDPEASERRLAELASDCFEQRRWGAEVGAAPAIVATSMVARTLAGVPADLAWRQAQLATARDRSPNPRGRPMGRWLKENWWVALAGIAGAMLTALGIVLPFEDGTIGALFGGIVIASLGLTMLGGIWVRRRHRARGDLMIAAGTLPLYPLVWTIVLPIVGLLVMIPALLDWADARASGHRNDADRHRVLDGTTSVLLAVVMVAIAATLVAGSQAAAYALVSPPLSGLVAHVVIRRVRLPALSRLGLTAAVAGVVHGVVTASFVVIGDSMPLGEGLAYVANSFMSAIGAGGLILFVIGLFKRGERARPA